MIELKDVVKRYRNIVALERVSFSVAEGEWPSIMDPSGSGKSTLFNLIVGLDTPDDGMGVTTPRWQRLGTGW